MAWAPLSPPPIIHPRAPTATIPPVDIPLTQAHDRGGCATMVADAPLAARRAKLLRRKVARDILRKPGP